MTEPEPHQLSDKKLIDTLQWCLHFGTPPLELVIEAEKRNLKWNEIEADND
jgi:hypothetical protein